MAKDHATNRAADVAGELEIVRREVSAGGFEHAVEHLIRALTAVGATAEVKDALNALASRVAETGSPDPDLTGL